MPNIDFTVSQQGGSNSPQWVDIRLRAVKDDLLAEIATIVTEASRRGAEAARRLAPRGHERARSFSRISDAIHELPTEYRPGGAGGGGFRTGGFYASSFQAPQLRYVMQGTADEGRGLIRPARGNVLAIEKEGEGVHFRAWVHGQRPNTRWWDEARDVSEEFVTAEIRDLRIPF